jgi:hypothetical protein
MEIYFSEYPKRTIKYYMYSSCTGSYKAQIDKMHFLKLRRNASISWNKRGCFACYAVSRNRNLLFGKNHNWRILFSFYYLPLGSTYVCIYGTICLLIKKNCPRSCYFSQSILISFLLYVVSKLMQKFLRFKNKRKRYLVYRKKLKTYHTIVINYVKISRSSPDVLCTPKWGGTQPPPSPHLFTAPVSYQTG